MSQKIIFIINESEQTPDKSISLPTLTPAQEKELETISNPLEKAERLIKMLGKIHYNIDPIAQQIKNDIHINDKIQTLYWNLIDDCENNYSIIFNKLHSGHLLEFLHPNHEPLF